MLYGMYLSATGLSLNQVRQEVVSNNLANVDTAGFKRQLAVFKSRPQESQEMLGGSRFHNRLYDGFTGGAFVSGTYRDFMDGSVQQTGRHLDVCLQGPGMLTVANGTSPAYTRDGAMSVVDDRLVLSGSGRAVLDDQGQEITTDGATSHHVRIGNDGAVYVRGSKVAQLGIVEFDDPQKLRALGSNLYSTTGKVGDQTAQAKPAVQTRVVTDAIEGSGVEPANELVDMIALSRQYQMNAAMLTLQDQTLGKLINDLPKA